MNKAILIMPVVAMLLVHACGLNEVNKQSQSSDVTTNKKGNDIINQGQATDSENGNYS
jgi:hypothetical protein